MSQTKTNEELFDIVADKIVKASHTQKYYAFKHGEINHGDCWMAYDEDNEDIWYLQEANGDMEEDNSIYFYRKDFDLDEFLDRTFGFFELFEDLYEIVEEK